jgi:hypothetical protein
MLIELDISNLSESFKELRKLIESFENADFSFGIDRTRGLVNEGYYEYLSLIVKNTAGKKYHLNMPFSKIHKNKVYYLYNPDTENKLLDKVLLELGKYIIKDNKLDI